MCLLFLSWKSIQITRNYKRGKRQRAIYRQRTKRKFQLAHNDRRPVSRRSSGTEPMDVESEDSRGSQPISNGNVAEYSSRYHNYGANCPCDDSQTNPQNHLTSNVKNNSSKALTNDVPDTGNSTSDATDTGTSNTPGNSQTVHGTELYDSKKAINSH